MVSYTGHFFSFLVCYILKGRGGGGGGVGGVPLVSCLSVTGLQSQPVGSVMYYISLYFSDANTEFAALQ